MKMHIIAFILSSLLAHPVFCAENPYPQVPIVNIVLVVDGKENELAQDMKALEVSGGCNMHAVSFTLHPENSPKPFDKMGNYSKTYNKILEAYHKLGEGNAKVGILMQSIMGHWKMNKPAEFQKIVSAKTGMELHSYCPLDGNFQAYARDCAARIASLKPDFAMVDDDTRLITGRYACVCPLHMRAVSKKLGYEISKNDLIKALNSTVPDGEKIGKAFDETIAESMYSLMRAIREGFDSVNPELPVMYCQCAEDARFSPQISKILAGKDNPTACRINNARYWHSGAQMRTFPANVYRTAIQTDICRRIDILLAETDPYPHNKYFTGARTLHSLLVESILEGCSGAKFWPNGSGIWDPESGSDYKRIFSENSGFYKELARLYKEFSPFGVTSPIPNKTTNWNPMRGFCTPKWNAIVFGRMGFPHNCARSKTNAKIFALDASIIRELSDSELKEILSKNAILDASAAIEISKRGFEDMIGVKVERVAQPTSALEDLTNSAINGPMANLKTPSSRAFEIILKEGAEALSHYKVIYDCSSSNGERMGIAAAAFENSAGGKIAVFAANVSDGKNMMHSSRKKMFESIFEWFGGFPITYTADAEMFLRAGELGDGSILAHFLNLGLDPLDTLEVRIKGSVSRIEKLNPNGEWNRVKFEAEPGGICKIDTGCETMLPVVLRIKR